VLLRAPIVGVARFARTTARSDTAELAIGVADAWQRRGVATVLLHQLADRAASAGIEHFTATILPENAPTIALLRGLGVTHFTREDSLLAVRTTPGDWPTTPPQRAGPRRQPAAAGVRPRFSWP
jgi:RimJ/RimL family protein N-acetyltransferase